jgi:ribosomal protein L7/L12
MADVFLSYASEDLNRAREVARALESAGWSVWWDRTLRAGQVWSNVIEHELNAAKCVVVLWSPRSVRANFVLEEAHEALARNVLVPVALEENVKPPLGFRRLHFVNLAGWSSEPEHPEFDALLHSIETHAPRAPASQPRKSRGIPRGIPAFTEEELRLTADPDKVNAVRQQLNEASIQAPWMTDMALAVILGQLQTGNPVNAIKVTRQCSSMGLKDAKEFVDSLKLRLQNPSGEPPQDTTFTQKELSNAAPPRVVAALRRNLEQRGAHDDWMTDTVLAVIVGYLLHGNKVYAIKATRQASSMGLVRAKEFVEVLQQIMEGG